jgi:hypothetical protein
MFIPYVLISKSACKKPGASHERGPGYRPGLQFRGVAQYGS